MKRNFQAACCYGDYDLVKILLDAPIIDPTADNFRSLRNACRYGHDKVVELILNSPKCKLTKEFCDFIFCNSCSDGYPKIIQLLLKDPGIDPSVNNNLSIRNACYEGHASVLALLLEDPRINITQADNSCFAVACNRGNYEIVKILLNDSRFDPCAENNLGFIRACCPSDTKKARNTDSYAKIIKLLLKDPRIDPAENFREIFHELCCNGNAEILKILLQDPRLDANVRVNKSIVEACKNNHENIILLILLHSPKIELDTLEKSVVFSWASITTFIANANVIKILWKRLDLNWAMFYSTLRSWCSFGKIESLEKIFTNDHGLSIEHCRRILDFNNYPEYTNTFLLSKKIFRQAAIGNKQLCSCLKTSIDRISDCLLVIFSIPFLKKSRLPDDILCYLSIFVYDINYQESVKFSKFFQKNFCHKKI